MLSLLPLNWMLREKWATSGGMSSLLGLATMLTLPSPLHGIPILIKANIGTFDRMSTTGECILIGRTILLNLNQPDRLHCTAPPSLVTLALLRSSELPVSLSWGRPTFHNGPTADRRIPLTAGVHTKTRRSEHTSRSRIPAEALVEAVSLHLSGWHLQLLVLRYE